MHFYRLQQNFRYFLCIIAIAVFLRSFIAPGYMIEASTEDGLGIIFCDGPVSLVVSEDNHHDHHHHGENGEAQQETHISPVCSQWSTSSQLVFNTIIIPLLFDIEHTTVFNLLAPNHLPNYSVSSRITRGPPVYI